MDGSSRTPTEGLTALCRYRCGGEMRNAPVLRLNQTGGKCLIDGLAEWRMLHKSNIVAQVYTRELVHTQTLRLF